MIWLRRKNDMFIFCLCRIGSRRARYVVVVSQSNRNCNHGISWRIVSIWAHVKILHAMLTGNHSLQQNGPVCHLYYQCVLTKTDLMKIQNYERSWSWPCTSSVDAEFCTGSESSTGPLSETPQYRCSDAEECSSSWRFSILDTNVKVSETSPGRSSLVWRIKHIHFNHPTYLQLMQVKLWSLTGNLLQLMLVFTVHCPPCRPANMPVLWGAIIPTNVQATVHLTLNNKATCWCMTCVKLKLKGLLFLNKWWFALFLDYVNIGVSSN